MKQSDEVRAKRLLQIKAEGARFRWNYILKSKSLWVAIVVLGAFVAAAVVTSEDVALNRVVFCLLGLLIGRIIRDMMWLKDIVDGFPFNERIINWDKVREIASKE